MFKSKTTKEFKKEVREFDNGTFEVLGEYKNQLTPIDIKCKKCNVIFKPKPKNFLSRKNKCLNCFNRKKQFETKKTKEEIEIEKGVEKIMNIIFPPRKNNVVELKQNS